MPDLKRSFPGLLRVSWQRLSPWPGGRRLFSALLGVLAPYSGSIGAVILEIRPGFARVALSDRRRVRNHLGSIHAIALMNLGEISTGLALHSGIPDDARAILAGLSIEYVKKARGTITATCECPILGSAERKEHEIEGVLSDGGGDVVARVRARWLVGPARAA